MDCARQRRELLRLAVAVESDSGRAFAPIEAIYGKFASIIPTETGRLAMVELVRDFSLVPWRPVLDRHIGQSVTGVARGDSISRTIGRGRTGLRISWWLDRNRRDSLCVQSVMARRIPF